MPPKSAKEFFANWKLWGLPAFAGIFAPWQNKLTEMALISEWFQPGLNVGTSVVGPLTCLVSFSVLHTRSVARIQIAARRSLISFVLLLLICFGLTHSVGIIWFPEPLIQILVWIFWAAAYLAMFALLGVAMVAGMLAIREKRKRKVRADKNGDAE